MAFHIYIVAYSHPLHGYGPHDFMIVFNERRVAARHSMQSFMGVGHNAIVYRCGSHTLFFFFWTENAFVTVFSGVWRFLGALMSEQVSVSMCYTLI